MANEADEASLAKANESLTNGGIAVVVKYSSELLNLLPFLQRERAPMGW